MLRMREDLICVRQAMIAVDQTIDEIMSKCFPPDRKKFDELLQKMDRLAILWRKAASGRPTDCCRSER